MCLDNSVKSQGTYLLKKRYIKFLEKSSQEAKPPEAAPSKAPRGQRKKAGQCRKMRWRERWHTDDADYNVFLRIELRRSNVRKDFLIFLFLRPRRGVNFKRCVNFILPYFRCRK
jgi:hypothetical protein